MENIKHYPGKCYRHQLRFKPMPSFDNNCPACWWESEAARRPTKRELDAAKAPAKDGPVFLKNIGGGTFVETEPPRK